MSIGFEVMKFAIDLRRDSEMRILVLKQRIDSTLLRLSAVLILGRGSHRLRAGRRLRWLGDPRNIIHLSSSLEIFSLRALHSFRISYSSLASCAVRSRFMYTFLNFSDERSLLADWRGSSFFLTVSNLTVRCRGPLWKTASSLSLRFTSILLVSTSRGETPSSSHISLTRALSSSDSASPLLQIFGSFAFRFSFSLATNSCLLDSSLASLTET